MLEEPNKEELDEQEIINKCISGANYQIMKGRGFPLENTQETNFLSPIVTDLSKTFEADVEEIVSKEVRKLFLIEGFQELLVYQNTYWQIYSEKTGQHPKSIILKNCLFKNKTEPMEAALKGQLIFDNCKLELTSNKHGNPDIQVQALINSDIVINSNIGELKISDQITNCVFSTNRNLTLRGRDTQFDLDIPKIISSVFFNKRVNFSHPFQLRLCKLNSILAEHGISIQSSVIGGELLLDSNIRHLEIMKSNVGRLIGSKIGFGVSAIFEKVRFHLPPKLDGCSFESSNVVFNDCTFDDKSSTTAQGAFRQLKSMCEKAGYEHGAIDFHALELETYYNLKFSGGRCPKGLGPEKIAHIFHKAFTDYGRDLTRPFVWLAVIFAINLIITFFSYYDLYSAPCDAFLKALKFSINGLFAPLSFALPYSLSARELNELMPSTLASIVNAIQAILSSLIWFLIIFMTRRRFKM